MNEERLQEIKDSVDFQKQILMAHNMETLCVDEGQELIEEIERLNNIINELENYLNEQVDYMTHRSIERMVAFDCCRHKLQELKESNGAIPPEVIGTNGEDGGLFDYGDR